MWIYIFAFRCLRACTCTNPGRCLCIRPTVDAKYPGISIAPYTPHALVFTLRSERRCSLRCSLVNVLTGPANFLRRRIPRRVFLLFLLLTFRLLTRPCPPDYSFQTCLFPRAKIQQRDEILADRNDWRNTIPSTRLTESCDSKPRRRAKIRGKYCI